MAYKNEFDEKTEKKLSEMGPKTKVLITGGAGYLGSVLTSMLVARGFDVTVYDNLSYSQNTLFDLFYSKRLKFIYGDVTNKAALAKAVSEGKYDYVLPLAAVVGFPVSELKPEITWMINHEAISTVLENRGDARIIFPTTNSGYGSKSGDIRCTEESPLEPISTYGKSKVAAEKAILEDGDSVCYRLATLFGFSPRMRTDLLVNHFVYKALNDGELVLFERKFKRNFAHVREASRGFLWAMANWEKMKGNVYNLGHPDYNITKEELALLIKKYLPKTNLFFSEIGSDPDKRNYIVSNERLLKTGFDFRYTLDDGIQELIQGYAAFKDYRFKNY